jgi:hypothetical protein
MSFKFTHNPRGNTLRTWRENVENKGKMKKKSSPRTHNFIGHNTFSAQVYWSLFKTLFTTFVHEYDNPLQTGLKREVLGDWLIVWTHEDCDPFQLWWLASTSLPPRINGFPFEWLETFYFFAKMYANCWTLIHPRCSSLPSGAVKK